MADLLIGVLKKSRSFLVAGLVVALLSSPFLANAGSQSRSSIVSHADDSIAGLSTEVEFEKARALQPIEILVIKPDGNQISLETVSDDEGETHITLSNTHLTTAGTYKVQARHSTREENFGAVDTFEVHTAPLSVSKSTVELSKNKVESGETVELAIHLMDAYGNAITGHALHVVSSKKSDEIYTPDFLTDESGVMNFYVKSTTKGISELSVLDTSLNKTLTSTAKLSVLSGSENFAEVGGFSNSFASILLAEEDGTLDSFSITGLEDEVEIGEELDFTVTALDGDGFTVSDYMGTIRFASTDDDSTLPNDYEFTEEDLGEHEFNLALKFLTPGTQTLTVTDVEQTNIIGEFEVEVLESTYESDFETEDFEREGDFTLISPASGTYSSGDLEVQGEGDYGYSAVIYLNEEEAARTEIEFDNSFSFTLEDLEDDEYDLYVDIVELGEGEEGEEEILEVIETSDVETIVIDTSAPELTSIEIDPEGALAAGSTAEITVLSETDLEEVSVLINEELYELEETATSGKYEGEVVMPAEEGEYSVDVILVDSLGNEVQYRDQLTLTVGEATVVDEEEEEDDETLGVGAPGMVSGLTVLPGEEKMTLSWESAAAGENAVAYYRVYYGPSPEALFATSDTFDASTSWFIPSLGSNQVYYFAVSAVDVEGVEGELSNVVSGVPLARVATTDYIPTTPTPAINSTGTPTTTPDSGPETTALMILSGVIALGYFATKKFVIIPEVN